MACFVLREKPGECGVQIWYNGHMDKKEKAAQALLRWYDENKRDLPWRRSRDVYAVLVSEMMLQQTRVDTVIDYYNRFMARFPAAAALAAASEADVLHAWQGLGYYSRARNLHKTAKALATDGIPTTYKKWLTMPGIGPYIAGAVMSIAQEIAQPAVDGNVLRVISRLIGSRQDITLGATKRTVESLVRDMMPEGRSGDFTQALMELGALVCKPTAPLCEACPLMKMCAAYQNGTADTIPVKTPKAKPKPVALWAAIVTADGYILLEHRGSEGLLKNMWGLPVVEKKSGETPESMLEEKYGIAPGKGARAGAVTHVFTHRRWEMDVLRYRPKKRFDIDTRLGWVRVDSLGEYAIPTAFKKVLALL